MDNEIHF